MEPLKDQPLKTSNNGQMDKVVKEEKDNQNEESRQTPDLQTVGEEEEPHERHSFVWCWNGEATAITCNKTITVKSLLETSSVFNDIATKNKNKELVILRAGKAISSHFPCSLIKNERLTIKYIKAVKKPKQSVSGSGHCQRKAPSSELVTFTLLTRGDVNMLNVIMINPELKNNFHEITVYAYKGEKVEDALKRDGRLCDTVFTKNCALSDTSTKVTTEMSDLVDELDGKTLKIKLLKGPRPPNSQPGSLDDAPPQQSSTESVNVDTPKEIAGLDGRKAPDFLLSEIPNSQKMWRDLSLQFREFMKGKKIQASGLTPIKHLSVEFGKNAETCLEVKTLKKLGELSNSVCQVRVNGKPKGSGFLLFDKFVLTNGHVLENIYNESTGQLHERVTVHFSYESVGQVDSGVEVEEVAGFENGCDASGHKHDWALLRIGAAQNLPDVLLTHFGLLPRSGAICIIGHPDCTVKKIDPCFIVPTENRNQVLERHWHENPDGVVPHNLKYSEKKDPIELVTCRFFEDVKNDEQNRQALTYETCFYFGSSGSPVFDEHCNVVAMHSGGYPYKNVKCERRSIIEFGYPLSIIIERIIVQMVKGTSRYMQAFIKAVNQQVTNESFKRFLEDLFQREVPVPMDT